MIRAVPLATSVALHLAAAIAAAIGGGGAAVAMDARSDLSVRGEAQPLTAMATQACFTDVRLRPATTLIAPPLPPLPPAVDDPVRLVCVHIDARGMVDAVAPLPGQDPVGFSGLQAFARGLRFHASAAPVWLVVVYEAPPMPATMA